LQILAHSYEISDCKKQVYALATVDRLLALPGLATEDEAWARLLRARVLFNNGKGDAEAAARAYEQIVAWRGAPSKSIGRAVMNGRAAVRLAWRLTLRALVFRSS
jgi:hypothetical protein